MSIDDSQKTLDEYRKEIQVKRKYLLQLSQEFDIRKEKYEEIFPKNVYQSLSGMAVLLEDAFMRLEIEAMLRISYKNQIDLLKDIIVQLPDVKNHAQIQKDIHDFFDKNDTSF